MKTRQLDYTPSASFISICDKFDDRARTYSSAPGVDLMPEDINALYQAAYKERSRPNPMDIEIRATDDCEYLGHLYLGDLYLASIRDDGGSIYLLLPAYMCMPTDKAPRGSMPLTTSLTSDHASSARSIACDRLYSLMRKYYQENWRELDKSAQF